MLRLTALLFASTLASCQHVAASETAIRVTDPSILQADVVDDAGKALVTYEIGSQETPHVRALVGGFTPVTNVYVVTDSPRREIGMRRKGQKLFELPVAELVETGILGPRDDALSFRIVAVDIEGDETTTDPIVLPIVAPAH